ncbi:MAG: NADH-quinone oxidoreductase subunit H, partial [Acidimicrobiia bacterium]
MTQFISDLFANPWVSLAGKLLLVGLIVPVTALVLGFAELKLSAKMQFRVGPYFAGGRWGWAQLLADGLKFFQKEDLIPEDADRPVFKAAPILVLSGTVALFVVIPFGPGLIFQDLSVGIFYALAISSISTIGVLMAGWSSANKYSLMGGLRAAGQLIAYELPLVLAVVGSVIMAGTMSMSGIV